MKDNIRYSDCLKEEIERKGADKKTVARGLYSESTLYDVLKGNTLPDFMKRNRLMARLGVVSDLYEDYLQNSEYRIWSKCEKIMAYLEEHKFLETLNLISEVERINKNKLISQFLLDMQSRCSFAKNGYSEEGYYLVRKARRISVPDFRWEEIDGMLFSDKEIYLMLSEIRYEYKLAVVSAIEAFKRIQQIYSWVMASYFDIKGRVKIIPYISSICGLLYDFCDLEQKRGIFYITKEAINELQYCNRLFFYREVFNLYIKASIEFGDNSETNQVERYLEVFDGLYDEYKVIYDMNSSAYIYVDSVKNSIGEIIKSRRKAFGLSQKELAKGICSSRTVSRIEKGMVDAQRFDVCGLLNKLNVQMEYRRSIFVTENIELVRLYEEYSRRINEFELEKANVLVEKILKNVKLDSVYNKQVVDRLETVMQWKKKSIPKEQCVKRLKRALELTVSEEDVLNNDDAYLTLGENLCLYSLAICRNKVDLQNDYFRTLKNKRNALKNKGLVRENLTSYCIFTDWLARKYIENDCPEEGKCYAEDNMKLSLKQMRCKHIYRSIEIIVAAMFLKSGKVFDSQYENKYRQAILAATFCNNTYGVKVYSEVLFKMKNKVDWTV